MSQRSNQLKTVSPQLLVLSPVGILGRGGMGVWHLDVGKDQAWNWLRSYLPDRFQFVYVHNQSAERKRISHGVPQGSVVGPLHL